MNMANGNRGRLRPHYAAPSTVGRGKAIAPNTALHEREWKDDLVTVQQGDSIGFYSQWESPNVIVSDGGYGVLGFEGDTSDHLQLPAWYEPHIMAWCKYALTSTTLWFWNSEIGWAVVHPLLEKWGWRYVNCNIWNKGKGHIAGNVNTAKIRRFPVVTEVCVQYEFEPRVNSKTLKEWLLTEWKRSGLALRKANEACGVADVATRKYFAQGHLWYFPPPQMFLRLQQYANQFGEPAGRPYFSLDGIKPATEEEWARMRAKFHCPHGYTNVWERNALHGKERESIGTFNGRAVHLNQKPLNLIEMIIRASSDPGDVVWEPFGGLFTCCVAARRLRRRAFGAEIDPAYFQWGMQRLKREAAQHLLQLSPSASQEQP